MRHTYKEITFHLEEERHTFEYAEYRGVDYLYPSYTFIEKFGVDTEEGYYQHGELHRLDEPAMVWRYPNGKIKAVHHRENGLLHNEEGPAVEWFNIRGQCVRSYWYRLGVEMEPRWKKLYSGRILDTWDERIL